MRTQKIFELFKWKICKTRVVNILRTQQNAIIDQIIKKVETMYSKFPISTNMKKSGEIAFILLSDFMWLMLKNEIHIFICSHIEY